MHDDSEHVERLFRIEAMKGELEELSGGQMQMGMAEDIPPEMAEEFLSNVLAYEKAPQVTHAALLTRDGVELPSPDELDDDQLALKLIEVIQTLADRHTYVECTNHLSDRELYAYLYHEALNESVPDLGASSGMSWHIDLISSGSDADTRLWMQYYADAETRAYWAMQFPDFDMPPHIDPPYDRDRHLPTPPPPANPYDDPAMAAEFWAECRPTLERLLDDEGFRYAPLSEEPEGWAPPYACIWKVCPPDAPDTLAYWGISGDLPTAVINAEGMPTLREFLDYISRRWMGDAMRLAEGDPPDELKAIPEAERTRMAHALGHVADVLHQWVEDEAEWTDDH